MGKPRMTPLAIAIKAAEPLSDEEKATLRDVLRPAPKPRQKGKDGKCVWENCGRSASAPVHNYDDGRFTHAFQSLKPERKPAQKRKAGKEATANYEATDVCRCGKMFDANCHHLSTDNDYHLFQPAGEAKGAGV